MTDDAKKPKVWDVKFAIDGKEMEIGHIDLARGIVSDMKANDGELGTHRKLHHDLIYSIEIEMTPEIERFFNRILRRAWQRELVSKFLRRFYAN